MAITTTAPTTQAQRMARGLLSVRYLDAVVSAGDGFTWLRPA
ncbi:hypothetical protein [Rhodoferax sp.]